MRFQITVLRGDICRQYLCEYCEPLRLPSLGVSNREIQNQTGNRPVISWGHLFLQQQVSAEK